MGKIIKSKDKTRQFERLSRWNIVDATFITRSNQFAKYIEDTNPNDVKLDLVYFKVDNVIYPLAKFKKLDSSITLEDFSVISMKSVDDDLLLEVNSNISKARLYKEV